VATEVKEHEDRSHSARYLVLIFLVLVAMCGVFFSAGFIVGRNERSLHSAPPTEVVTTPGVVPPTVNPPPDTTAAAPGTNPAAPNTVPESEVIPPGPEAAPGPAVGKPPEAAPPAPQPTPKADQPETAPPPADMGKGITLQVLAMHTKQDAESVVTVLKGKGYPVFLLTPENAHADDSLYRVLVGPFKTRDEAEKARDRLKDDGFKPFIRH
jgi:cell division septation protein DedD